MAVKLREWWHGVEVVSKIGSLLVVFVMVLLWLFNGNVQGQANARDIAELKSDRDTYQKVINRIDRRLYRLELAHKIQTEPVDGR